MVFEQPHPHFDELDAVQNPALGAYLLWRFGIGFQLNDQRAAELPLLFLVLPLLLHRPALDCIGSTRPSSGLALFAAKLAEQQEQLVALHERAVALRSLSFQSLRFAARHGLISINYGDATARANTLIGKKPVVPERLKEMASGAEKVGRWFSQLSLNQIANLLRVDF